VFGNLWGLLGVHFPEINALVVYDFDSNSGWWMIYRVFQNLSVLLDDGFPPPYALINGHCINGKLSI